MLTPSTARSSALGARLRQSRLAKYLQFNTLRYPLHNQQGCYGSTPKGSCYRAMTSEPVNAERGAWRSPIYWLVFVLPVCVFGFKMAKYRTPPTSAMQGMRE
ncbi:BZ3500_MvSof-1268-A1-R1_Chr5-3g08248 [Microbotryum saponariae]|uniref:BZ3500_MvSof-1268-A1-R1_Chr5-3g08248 protein n=1 Tax=Microbotryum saponariae TaxID=289078 RepID=A0A2X0KZX8_9BASI|nr:BZ3500_MvSof-1268-A1-R1_Chr5-3g08248 [Microbotryum saponariae]SDA08356.1 BZ3501_MvSof-1269-A2-R1_Chr5-3g07976 [Microbotryum saponariae]